jgi:hypothetical protein
LERAYKSNLEIDTLVCSRCITTRRQRLDHGRVRSGSLFL